MGRTSSPIYPFRGKILPSPAWPLISEVRSVCRVPHIVYGCLWYTFSAKKTWVCSTSAVTGRHQNTARTLRFASSMRPAVDSNTYRSPSPAISGFSKASAQPIPMMPPALRYLDGAEALNAKSKKRSLSRSERIKAPTYIVTGLVEVG